MSGRTEYLGGYLVNEDLRPFHTLDRQAQQVRHPVEVDAINLEHGLFEVSRIVRSGQTRRRADGGSSRSMSTDGCRSTSDVPVLLLTAISCCWASSTAARCLVFHSTMRSGTGGAGIREDRRGTQLHRGPRQDGLSRAHPTGVPALTSSPLRLRSLAHPRAPSSCSASARCGRARQPTDRQSVLNLVRSRGSTFAFRIVARDRPFAAGAPLQPVTPWRWQAPWTGSGSLLCAARHGVQAMRRLLTTCDHNLLYLNGFFDHESPCGIGGARARSELPGADRFLAAAARRVRARALAGRGVDEASLPSRCRGHRLFAAVAMMPTTDNT